MMLHLYWIDKNWKKRGYANNYNLVINFKDKTYGAFTNSYCDYIFNRDIEVKRKTDIDEYIEYLKENGYKEMS